MEPYKNLQLTIHERVVDLLGKMTLKEKVGQVNQHLYGWKVYEKNEDGKIELTEYFKEHVKWGGGLGALYGLFRADPWSQVTYENGISPEESRDVRNKIQHYIKKHSRLGIPALFVEECPHGHQALDSVSYPTNIGRGAMFNTDLVQVMSEQMAEELSYKGVHLALVSTLDLARDPRWGRTEECFGEDPYLAKIYSEAIIKGFQGCLIKEEEDFTQKTVGECKKESHQIGVVLKHFIAQGDALGGHNSGDVSIGPRELFDSYHPVMESVKNAVGVMAAYNDIDGLPCHANKLLLKENLRKEIGFKGLVMADGGALDRLQSSDFNAIQKAKQGLEAGVDLSLWDQAYLSIEEGVRFGDIKEESLNEAVYHVLAVKFLLGLFDESDSTDKDIDWKRKKSEWQKINLESAREGIVLLKNEDKLLPLKSPEKIAVIGPNADALYHQLGDYTSPQTFKCSTTVLEGIKKIYKNSDVFFAEGCQVRNQVEEIDYAYTKAKEAEVIILVLGGSSARDFGTNFLANGAVASPEKNMDSGENIDVSSLSLGGYQLELLRKLAELNKPIVTILIQGRPYELSEVVKHSKAVLIGWFPGQKGGQALAEVISGRYSPNGKLSISIPYESGQLPVYYNQKLSMKKEDYFDQTGKPHFSFGDGESYSKISYRDLKIENEEYYTGELKAGGKIHFQVKVRNSGPYDTKESVLCFIQKRGTPLLSRKKELKRFRKISLKSGEEKELYFSLRHSDLLQLGYDLKPTIFSCELSVIVGGLKETCKIKDTVKEVSK